MQRPSLPVVVTSIVLLLSILYALTFSNMLFLSLQEELSPVDHLPRYIGRVHHHNAVEWLLIVGPALAGWIGVGASLFVLVRRWLRPRRSGG